jgi:hypothetical protein
LRIVRVEKSPLDGVLVDQPPETVLPLIRKPASIETTFDGGVDLLNVRCAAILKRSFQGDADLFVGAEAGFSTRDVCGVGHKQ